MALVKSGDLQRLADLTVRLGGEAIPPPELPLVVAKRHPELSVSERALVIDTLMGQRHPKGAHLPPGTLLLRGFFEQASSPLFASYHGALFSSGARLIEVGTGLGFDTAALATEGRTVFTVERDPLVAAIARHNLAVAGRENVMVIVGAAEELVSGLIADHRIDALFADPGRREGDARLGSDPEQASPSLSSLLGLERLPPEVVVKLAPGAEFSSPPGWRRSWIGVSRECREQLLVRGDGLTSAILLSEGSAVPTVYAPQVVTSAVSSAPAPLAYLLDPEPALSAANLFATFLAENRGALFGGYGTVAELPPIVTPWCHPFRVIACFPFRQRALATWMADHGWGALTTFKKRRCDVELDTLPQRLGLSPGGNPRHTVLLTSVEKQVMVVCAERG